MIVDLLAALWFEESVAYLKYDRETRNGVYDYKREILHDSPEWGYDFDFLNGLTGTMVIVDADALTYSAAFIVY